MKLALRRTDRAAAAAMRRPILPGYRDWNAGGLLSRYRKTFLTLLFLVTFLYAGFFAIAPRGMTVMLSFPIVVLYLFIVWALPVRDYAPSPALTWLFWAYFVSLVIWPNYLAISLPGLPWITVARLFGGPLIFLTLLHVSNCGPYRQEMKAILSHSPTIVKLVATFAVLQMISTAFSDVPFDTLNRVINTLIVWTGMFFASIWVFRRLRAVEAFVLIYIAMAFVLCVIALLEARQGSVLWANSIPQFLKVDDPAVQRVLAGAYRLGSIYRVVATSTTPLSLAELLGASTPFLIYAFIEYRSLLGRIALVLLDCLVLYVIILTDARLGAVAFIVGHIAYLLYFTLRLKKFGGNSLLGTSLMMLYPIAFTGMVAAVLFVGRIRSAVIGDGSQQYSDNARQEQFAAAAVKIWGSPLFGFGSGRGGPRLGFTNPEGTLTIDSYLLSILMDYGILGFVVYYSMFVLSIVRGFKIGISSIERPHHLAMAISIFLMIFLTTKLVLSQEINNPLIFIAMGAIVALSYICRPQPSRLSKIML